MNQTVVIPIQIFFLLLLCLSSYIATESNKNNCHKLFCLLCLFSSFFHLTFKVIPYLINHRQFESYDTHEFQKNERLSGYDEVIILQCFKKFSNEKKNRVRKMLNAIKLGCHSFCRSLKQQGCRRQK